MTEVSSCSLPAAENQWEPLKQARIYCQTSSSGSTRKIEPKCHVFCFEPLAIALGVRQNVLLSRGWNSSGSGQTPVLVSPES
mmetsp:Transcript_18699/g.40192  ORF Transcript_18699/g.40192 Transcript_18699/m.40192 type:complete len:82 (+) Transcript_18699:367-612(+)